MKTNHTSKGYKWVHNGETNRLVKPDVAQSLISEGWQIGFSSSYKQKYKAAYHHFERMGKSKTDEDEILRKHKISNSMKGNRNWEHNKSHGAAKQGWYNGIYCDSSWELAFLIYHIEHDLFIERCKEKRSYFYKGEIRTYIPDFVTDEGVIEIKGYVTEQWKAKISQNPDIKVMYESDMKSYLDYTISKYGQEFWKILYE